MVKAANFDPHYQAASQGTVAVVASQVAARIAAASHYVNVKTYGATGDGTTDDTLSLQEAIDATPSFATLFLPVGTYKITATLIVSDHIRLLGAGGYLAPGATPSATAIVMTTDNTTAISQTNHPGYLTIEGIHIVNTGLQASGKGINALGSIILRFVYVDGFYDGIYVDALTGDPYNVYIESSTAHDCTRAGLYLDGKVNNFQLNTFHGFSNAYGIYASGGFYAGLIANGDFEGNSTSAITIEGTASSQTADTLLIQHCFFEQIAGSSDISIGPTTLVQGVTIQDCYFEGLEPASFWHIDINHADRVTILGGHVKQGSGAGSIRANASNSTNVMLVNVEAEGTVSLPTSAVRVERATVTPEPVAAASDPGTSPYFARADHVHEAGVTEDLVTVDAGTPTYDDTGDDVVVTVASDWGYDADGPYYDSTGTASGEEALLVLDRSSGELAVIPYAP